MEPEVVGARRYRPLHRTPPEYQTIIKFLLMTSLLDTVWVSGPPLLGSPCTLVGGEASAPQQQPGQRSAALTSAGPPLPPEVQEALSRLNISAEDCVRRPDTLRMGGLTTAAVRVLSVLAFNAFVLWSDFGAALLGSRAAGAAPWGSLPSAGLAEQTAALGPWGDAGHAAATWTPASEAAFRRAASGDCLAAAAEACGRTFNANGSEPLCYSVLRTATDAGSSSTPEHVPDYDVQVPWPVQLLYVVILIVMVVSMPCCPAVFENACSFLMC